MKTLLVTLSVVAILTGCGTTPTAISEAKPIAAERVFVSSLVSTASPATLTVIRDSGLHGAEHVFEIHVNAKHVASLRQGEKFNLPLNAGQTFIEARMHNILGKVPPVQVETNFVAGKEYFYRVGLDELNLRLLRDVALTK
jgi:hypothetical protein